MHLLEIFSQHNVSFYCVPIIVSCVIPQQGKFLDEHDQSLLIILHFIMLKLDGRVADFRLWTSMSLSGLSTFGLGAEYFPIVGVGSCDGGERLCIS